MAAPAANPNPVLPGSHLRQVTDQRGRMLKEVNVPPNAMVEEFASRPGKYYHYVTTLGGGDLLFAGQSCTDRNCSHAHNPWPTSGSFVIPSCAVVCEVCGLLRQDFRICSSNLRRHVVEEHQIEPGETRDVNIWRLYDQVLHLQGPRPQAGPAAPAAPMAAPMAAPLFAPVVASAPLASVVAPAPPASVVAPAPPAPVVAPAPPAPVVAPAPAPVSSLASVFVSLPAESRSASPSSDGSS